MAFNYNVSNTSVYGMLGTFCYDGMDIFLGSLKFVIQKRSTRYSVLSLSRYQLFFVFIFSWYRYSLFEMSSMKAISLWRETLSPLSAVCSSYPTLRRLAVISSSDTSNIFSIYLRQCQMPNVIGLYESTIVAH